MDTSHAERQVGYDVRTLHPRPEERLDTMFERVARQALAEGKRPAVLFRADWCQACRTLELELGNMHPHREIGHIRVFQLTEEDWDKRARQDEFNALMARLYHDENVYPVLMVLSDTLAPLEEMKQAVDRLGQAGQTPKLSAWFATLEPPAQRPAVEHTRG